MGFETDTGATLLSSFLYFYAHSFLRMVLLRRKARAQAKAVLSVFEELLVGYLAGVTSRLLSTPLSLVTVRLQNEKEKDEKSDAKSDTEERKGVVAVMRELYEEGGLAGFWRGFTLTIILSCNPALTYAFTSLFLHAMRRTRPTPSQSFLAGATGNALAVCIIYPLILAKDASHRIRYAHDNQECTSRYCGDIRRARVVSGFASAGAKGIFEPRLDGHGEAEAR